jgi:hypothetical protein
MGSPWRRAAVTLALACVPLTTAFASASPLVFGTASMVCTGTVQVGYSPPITAVPATGPTTVTLSTPAPLQCTTGLVTSTATISVTGTNPAGAACAGPIAVVEGGGTITVDGGTPATVVWEAAGTTAAQSWLFAQLIVPPTLEAAGAGAWTAIASGAGGCVMGSASTIPFFAAMVIVV